jgi:hypothetical protein
MRRANLRNVQLHAGTEYRGSCQNLLIVGELNNDLVRKKQRRVPHQNRNLCQGIAKNYFHKEKDQYLINLLTYFDSDVSMYNS